MDTLSCVIGDLIANMILFITLTQQEAKAIPLKNEHALSMLVNS